MVDRCADEAVPGAPPSWWRGPRRRLGLLALAAACAGLAVLYFRQSLTVPLTSDAAGNILQGQAMAQGNVLLRGWWSSDVSFYSTELLEYALVAAIRGLSPNIEHICGALTYTVTVLLAALVARGRARGAAGYCRAGIAIGISLAPTLTGSIGLYLQNPNHAGTAVPVLVLLLLVERAEGPAPGRPAGRWLVPVAACALLMAADVGDELTLAIATVPLGGICVIRLLASRGLGDADRGRAQRPLDGSLLAAAAASAVLAWLANPAIRALGGFVLRPVSGVAVAPLSQVPTHANLLWQAIIIMFGAHQPGTSPEMSSVHVLLVLMQALHVVGLVLAAAGLAAGIASLRSRRADRATQVLAASILVLLAFGVFTTLVRSHSYYHEVGALMPLSAALAGRVLVPLARRWLPARPRSVQVATLALGAWLALTVAEVGYTATWPASQSPQQAVADWLVSHHQRDGLSGYWQATSTTVTSGGQVLVAGITLPGPPQEGQPMSDRAAAYRWESSADWYQPSRHHATFVIAVTGPVPSGGLTVPEVRAAFGPPVAQHQIGGEAIMLYDYNLLSRLTPTPFP
jgi:hypothetical protein